MPEIICACGCGRRKNVRQADINRGWGKYYSKSCKAKAQEKRTGQYKKHLKEQCNDGDELSHAEINEIKDDMEFGWDSHKIWR